MQKVRKVCAAKESLAHFAHELSKLNLPPEKEMTDQTKDLSKASDVRNSEVWKMLISTQGKTLRTVMSSNVRAVRVQFSSIPTI